MTMKKFKNIFGAMLVGVLLAGSPAVAAEAGLEVQKQSWSFAGPFGTYDKNQLQRGFQVFREVCASCHGANLMAFRNLSEFGGPTFTEGQVKALAAEYEVVDPEAEGGRRPAVAADRWPSPFASEAEAAEANGGIAPPDFSVIAKARGTTQPFPWWILNYFTPYQEGGPDYIHALLTGYHDEVPANAPEDFELPVGKYYNDYYPGHAIGMGPPLSDGLVTYAESESGTVPLTVDQYSRDVSAFLMWVAEPHLVARKQAGLSVIAFLILFAGLLYAVKRRLWAKIEH
jgi:ubiquinol-cytochrome c reductase cytochrome c1 subunit